MGATSLNTPSLRSGVGGSPQRCREIYGLVKILVVVRLGGVFIAG